MIIKQSEDGRITIDFEGAELRTTTGMKNETGLPITFCNLRIVFPKISK